jgi:hypothetical protein
VRRLGLKAQSGGLGDGTQPEEDSADLEDDAAVELGRIGADLGSSRSPGDSAAKSNPRTSWWSYTNARCRSR